ncbi:MAG TPA: hypothetical protein VGB00_14065 [Pyrinomonadaceae bacterium]
MRVLPIFFVIIFQTPPIDVYIELAKIVVPAFFVGLFTWLFTRRKTNSETDKNLTDIVEKLPVWIERFEKAKAEVITVGDLNVTLRRELDKAALRDESCKVFRAKTKDIFNEIELKAQNFEEFEPVIEKMRELKKELEPERPLFPDGQ